MSNSAEQQFNLAQQLYSQAKFIDSESIMAELIKNNSKIPEFYYFLGLIQLNQNKLIESERNFKKALKLKPIFPMVNSSYAHVFIKRGDFILAKKQLEIALKLDPNIVENYSNLALLYYELNEVEKGVNLIKSLLNKEPNNIEALDTLTLGYIKLFEFDIALETAKRIEKIDPSRIPYVNLAQIYKQLYQYEDAIECYENELSKNPHNHKAALALADIWYKNLYDENKAINVLNNYLTLSQNKQNKIFNKIGDIYISKSFEKEALEYYLKVLSTSNDNDYFFALSSASSLGSFDLETYLENVRSTINNCDSEAKWLYFNALAKYYEKKQDDNKFIDALNKSNKFNIQTCNEYFKKSHENNDQFGILNSTLNRASNTYNNVNDIRSDSNFTPIFIVGMPRSGTTLLEQMVSNHPKVFGAGEVNFFSLSMAEKIAESSCSSHDYSNLISKIQQDYTKNLSQILRKYNYIIDKNPFNFRFVDILIDTFKSCKILHISRKSQAVCWSIYKNPFGSQTESWTSDMRDIIRYYKLYEEIMDKWYEKYPNNIYSVNYELLTKNPELEIKKILDFCGLDWNRQCIDLDNNSRSVRTLSSSQIRNKIYTGSSDAWEKYSKYFPQLNAEL